VTVQNDNTVISCPELAAKDQCVSLARPVLIRDMPQRLARAHGHLLAFIFLLLLSLPFRLVNLGEPFTGEHEFRQTQTALSVWEMRAHGISLLHPKLPLFGPPWECPFEYPIFQFAAAAIDSLAPWRNLDVSIRITNVMFFYLAAVALYLLGRLLFRKAAVSLFAIAIYVFSTYNIFWSRTSMIESAATFFALAYLASFIRWTFKPGWVLFLLCLIFGILGALTKITTFVIPIFICCVLTGLEAVGLLRRKFQRRQASALASATAEQSIGNQQANTRQRGFRIVWLTCLLLIPLIVGQWYTRYGDNIKEKSDYTKWLSSNHPYMKRWAYGTREQRLDVRKWDILQHRIQGVVTPCFAIALVIGICALPFLMRGFSRLAMGDFCIGCGLVLAPMAAIGLFFNLYFIHTYYLNACAPFFALCAGVGLWLGFKSMRTDFMKTLYVLLLAGLWLWTASPQFAQACYSSKSDPRLDYLNAASKIIPADAPVIILSATEWSSFAPYYLKRRAFMGMMVNKPVNIHQRVENDYFKKNGFHWLLIEGRAPGIPELAGEIMQRWKTSRLVSVSVNEAPYLLYSLSDE
jgi:4-amino-4-deoxy-L-arabinose transferase-like glycosyltransferase